MTDPMQTKIDDFTKLDLEKLPQPIKVYLDEGSPIVIIDSMAFFRTFLSEGDFSSDPATWAVLLADIVRHVAKAHHQVLSGFASRTSYAGAIPPEEAILERIMEVLVAEIGEANDIYSGHTHFVETDDEGNPKSKN